MDKPAKERIPLSEKYYICGVALWTRELFQLVGYIRPQKYDSNGWMKLIYHLRSLAFISTHLGENDHSLYLRKCNHQLLSF